MAISLVIGTLMLFGGHAVPQKHAASSSEMTKLVGQAHGRSPEAWRNRNRLLEAGARAVPAIESALSKPVLGAPDFELAGLLAKFGSPAEASLLRLLRKGNSYARCAAAYAFAEVAQERHRALRFPRQRSTPATSKENAATLARTAFVEHASVTNALVAALDDAAARDGAIRAVGWLRIAGTAEKILPFTYDEDGARSGTAFFALARVAQIGELSLLREAFHRAKTAALREPLTASGKNPWLHAVVRDLAGGESEASFQLLLEWTHDPDSIVRATTCEGFAIRLDPRAIDTMARLMTDPAANVRIAVAESLLGFPPDRVRPLLEKIKSDPEPSVRDAAIAALERLGK